LRKCHRINFYIGWKYNWHKRSHIIYKIAICLLFYTWWIWTGIKSLFCTSVWQLERRTKLESERLS